MPKKNGFPLIEFGFIAAGLGVLYWFHKEHATGGEDLWSALGYPYGATGNLPGMGADFKTGNITGSLSNGAAIPVIMTMPAPIFNSLTDTTGVVLTDTLAVGITDVPFNPPSQPILPRNAAAI